MTETLERQIVKTLMMISIAFALIMGWSAYAQRPMGSPQDGRNPEEQIERLKERLDLSDQQAEELRPIFEESREKLQALREQYQDQSRSQETMEAFRSEREALQEETNQKLATVLSDGQLKDFQEMQGEARANLRQGQRQGEGQRQGQGQRSGQGRGQRPGQGQGRGRR
ncbi:MAG: hypothetical protein O6826_07655 [Acidobacteria bacterium]|nr:hypothetical protein [Acidobacteriota bacterium]MCZ6767812.1 hypothetical protein [Acidobacteriota bacterium]MCZ6879100.1 hypothetical protein [Acidobacteriota bacterium]